MSLTHQYAQARLLERADATKAAVLAGFFKTGKGQYGEGDQFLGVMVPAVREIAAECRDLGLADCASLLESRYNEARLLALLILVQQYRNSQSRPDILGFYLSRLDRVNNWNLVDSSAPHILGAGLLRAPRGVLYQLAQSPKLWERRIAIMATFAFIREHDFEDSLAIAQQLLGDPQDLLHKACGWMLREIGKRDMPRLDEFLRRHCRQMPRTMLRYAIEKMPPAKRQAYLVGTAI
jgi:3-methyladenine DNA glycosylase AlkD